MQEKDPDISDSKNNRFRVYNNVYLHPNIGSFRLPPSPSRRWTYTFSHHFITFLSAAIGELQTRKHGDGSRRQQQRDYSRREPTRYIRFIDREEIKRRWSSDGGGEKRKERRECVPVRKRRRYLPTYLPTSQGRDGRRESKVEGRARREREESGS